MSMGLRMKVSDIFVIGQKTIFAGQLETSDIFVSNVKCVLQIDGQPFARVVIKGEVSGGSGRRDLWTDEPVVMDRNKLKAHDVWLIAD